VIEARCARPQMSAPDRDSQYGRSIVLAMNELSDFFERHGDPQALVETLRETDRTIAALQAEYPDQPFFPEARAPLTGARSTQRV
jgi:hypothetical protein